MEEKDRMRRENVQNSENALKDTYEKKLSEEQVEQDEVGIDEEKLTEEQMKEIGAVIRAAAEDTPIPSELEPEAIEELLRKHRQGQESTSGKDGTPAGQTSASDINGTHVREANTSDIDETHVGEASTSDIDGTFSGVDRVWEENGDRRSKKKRPGFLRHARIYIGAAAAAVLVITALWRFSGGVDNGYTGDETTMATSESAEEYAEELAEGVVGGRYSGQRICCGRHHGQCRHSSRSGRYGPGGNR
ncbi:hypothetical protein RJD28_01130 [Oscillospiraceae bacterium NTUH-002-81]|nr:hypothetical protein RJD28_01130 [Oscillospiraceae bacterium NTUH-002-81]